AWCSVLLSCCFFFFFSSRRRHTRSTRDWSSDVCSSDLRAGDRQSLLSGLDQIERQADQSGLMKTVDRYQQDAFSMVLGGKARERSEERRVGKECGGRWARYE